MTRERRSRATAKAFGVSAFAAVVAAAAALFTVSAGPAEALPSYARQTGQPCATCHTAFPELTPYGRRSGKIGGYTAGGGDWKGPPIAAMYMPSFTHTRSDQDAPPAPGLHTNDNLVSQQVSGFIAGQLFGNLGSFIQITGDPTVAGKVFVWTPPTCVTPIRSRCSARAPSGASTPTIRRLSKIPGTPRHPSVGPSDFLDHRPSIRSAADPHRERIGPDRWRRGRVCDFWKRHAVRGLHSLQGTSGPRAAGLQHRQLDDRRAVKRRTLLEGRDRAALGRSLLGVPEHSACTHGSLPGRIYGFGTDDFLDVGFDSQIQYAGDQYSITVKLTDIMEWQRLNSSFAQAISSNLSNKLNSFKANASFVWDHTYSVGVGYFNIAGSGDCNLYGSGNNVFCTPTSIGSFNNSFISSPNGAGLIQDLAYLPFSHGAPFPYSTWNVRIGLQFTEYLHLFGGTTNFDGSNLGGTHNASGNNSVFAYAWIAF